MLLGRARVSTADQNPDHQADALTRAGVAPLVVTRLDRLARSVLHLAAARARRGGRPARLSPTPEAHARELYAAGEHTVADNASLPGMSSTTVYGHHSAEPIVGTVTNGNAAGGGGA